MIHEYQFLKKSTSSGVKRFIYLYKNKYIISGQNNIRAFV